MLDQRIARGDVASRDVTRVAESLAAFHAGAPRFEVLPSEYRWRLARDVADALRELSRPELGLPAERVTAVGAAQLRLIDSRPELFDERVRGGHIVEAHGDLRAEHVCLASTISIIDCLEFNRGFRMLDTASEMAFLALECERLGAPKIATALSEAHARALGDRPPALLSRFHEGLHAMVRAKIAVWHLAEPRLDGVDKWLDKARHYLELAESRVLGAA
jgi:aminoglycoside phosphotransferase family enzyme